MSSSDTQKHIVAFPYQAWGHARPLINLSARLVKMKAGVTVSLLSTDLFYARAKAELARSFGPGEEEYARRVRLVSVGGGTSITFDSIDEAFPQLWEKLDAGEEVVCATSGERFAALSKPDIAIVDLFATRPIHEIRQRRGDTIKIYSWMGGSTYALFYLFGPEKLGGRGDCRAKIEKEASRTGKRFEDAAMEYLFTPKGEIIRAPGLPPMSDYEYHPQLFPMPEELALKMFPDVHTTLGICDGVFLITPEPYEPVAVAAVREWYAETNRPVYVCGPLLPESGSHAAKHEQKQSKESTEIQEFLDTHLKISGEKSVLYISFGSIFWPVRTPEKLWEFLDVVMERNIPFILSHASPMAVVPDEIREKVKAYGKGLLSAWTPQQTILEHPATGWILSHGGHNGVTEAICAGVPLILWPFNADQPTNSVHISEQLKIGYELIEVRTGHGLHPIFRNGRKPAGTTEALKAEARYVLSKAFGEDGAEKRKRIEVLRRAVLGEWEEGGSALRNVRAFLESL